MPENLTTLINHLRSGTASIQQEAAQQLAQLGPGAQSAAVPLVEALATEDDQLREWATSALEDLGPPLADAVPQLAAHLKQPALDSAYWAATLLGRLGAGSESAVPALIASLEEHPEIAVRERSAWALGEIGTGAIAASSALEKATRTDHRRLATLAGEALSRLKG